MSLAESETGHRNHGGSRSVIVGRNQAPRCRKNLEAVKVVTGDVFTVCDFGLLFDLNVEVARWVECEQA